MLHLFLSHRITGVAVLLCVLGLAKGGPADRWGGVLLVVACLGTISAQSVTGRASPVLFMLADDVILAAGFLWLALRFSSLWLGVAMLAQAAGLSLHALALSEEAPGYRLYLNAQTYVSWLVLASLLFGTLSSWRRRAKGGAPAEAPPLGRLRDLPQ